MSGEDKAGCEGLSSAHRNESVCERERSVGSQGLFMKGNHLSLSALLSMLIKPNTIIRHIDKYITRYETMKMTAQPNIMFSCTCLV